MTSAGILVNDIPMYLVGVVFVCCSYAVYAQATFKHFQTLVISPQASCLTDAYTLY